MEKAGLEVPSMGAFEGFAVLEIPSSSDAEVKFIQHNWPLLAYIMKTGDDQMLKDVENAMPDKKIMSKSLEILSENEHALPDKEVLARILDIARQVEEWSPSKEDLALSVKVIRFDNNKQKVLVQSEDSRIAQASDDSFFPGLPNDTSLDVLARSSRSYYPMLTCVNSKYKSLIDCGTLYKLRRQLGIVEHWVYLACLLKPWEAYDPMRRRWMRLPEVPSDDCFNYADKESLAVGTQLLVFGKELPGFAVWMYSLLTREWSRCPPMNFPRCLFGSSSFGEIAIVAGGTDRNGNVLKCAELYNSEVGTWDRLPDLNSPRKLCSGFFMDGKFFVIGGLSNHTDGLTCGEEYNLETRTWRTIENMYPEQNLDTPPAMRSPPLVAVVNNQLYIADQATNQVKKYDKINNSWLVVKPLPVRADSSNGWGLAFKACGNNLLVIGGHRDRGEVFVIYSWCPDNPNAEEDWNTLSVRERAGTFIYNCAVMGC